MHSKIKHIKPFAVLVVVGLISTQIISLISKYCYCESEKPQFEILSISECNHGMSCESGHQHCNKNSEQLKTSQKNCTYSFIEQLIYTEQKNSRNKNCPSIIFNTDSASIPREYSLFSNFTIVEIYLPHNRFIDIINEVQLLI